jgi:aspartate 1-decarboxylase
MHAKLHRVRITQCKPDYVGSLGIDRIWMKRIGLVPLQEIHCWNVTRGTRFVTYAIGAPAGSKEISPNGACAHLCREQDLLIIAAFKQRSLEDVHAAGHVARVLIFGDDGEPSEYSEQTLTVNGDDFTFAEAPEPLVVKHLLAAGA